MIWRDIFPWRTHRTLAEVVETETLREIKASIAPRTWQVSSRAPRLHALEARAVEIPHDPDPPAIA